MIVETLSIRTVCPQVLSGHCFHIESLCLIIAYLKKEVTDFNQKIFGRKLEEINWLQSLSSITIM